MTIKRALLVGNGFNQIIDEGASWQSLLNQLAGTPLTAHEEEVRKAKPFTLWFEALAKQRLSTDLKKIIAEYLSNHIPHNDHHSRVMQLDFRDILTTNYDLNLESSLGQPWKTNNTALESYYSLFRRNSFKNKHVWHIHGDIRVIKSIMLGHEQYSGYIHKVRNYLTLGVQNKNKLRNAAPYTSKYSHSSNDDIEYIQSWVDVFLESEVHIIGFGFDYTENHLWNLITEKNKLKKRGEKVGNVVFHRCSNRSQSTAEEAKISIMHELGVKTFDYRSKSYSGAYDKCIKSLS